MFTIKSRKPTYERLSYKKSGGGRNGIHTSQKNLFHCHRLTKVIMQIWLTLASPHPSSVHSCFLLQITLTCCESGVSPQVWMSLSSDLAEDKNEETAVVVNRFHSGGNTEE